MVITEALFHHLITLGFSDTPNLGVYEKARTMYGKGIITSFSSLPMIDATPRVDYFDQSMVLGRHRDSSATELEPGPQADAIQIHDHVNVSNKFTR